MTTFRSASQFAGHDDESESSHENDDGNNNGDSDLMDAIAASPDGTTVIPLKETVAIINRILPPGIDIPDTVNEQNFTETLELVVSVGESGGMIPTAADKAKNDAERKGVSSGGTTMENPDVLVADDPLAEFPAEFRNSATGKAMGAGVTAANPVTQPASARAETTLMPPTFRRHSTMPTVATHRPLCRRLIWMYCAPV